MKASFSTFRQGEEGSYARSSAITHATSEIGSFFRGKTLLVTGATGFLGKALIERILWQLPQVHRLILLIRPHTPQDPAGSVRLRAEREIFRSSVFNRLRAYHAEAFDALIRDKVEIVPGDLTCPDLGLPADCVKKWEWEIDLVINLAALVGFDERLDHSINSNTLGPYHLLNFANRFRNPTMLHVSTAFVHGRQAGCISEQILRPNTSPNGCTGTSNDAPFELRREIEQALRLAQSVESESRTPSAMSEFRYAATEKVLSDKGPNSSAVDMSVEQNRSRWVGNILSQQGLSRARRYGWFDTYTFTKAMGEQLLVNASNGLPIIILRPSIIESSLMQPEPGWIEGFQTSTPILFGYGKGEVPDFPAKRDGVIDIIPVDFVVSTILASLAAGTEGTNPKVFHVSSSGENPLRLGDLMEYCRDYFQRFPVRAGKSAPQPWKYRSRYKFDWWLERSRRILGLAIALNDHINFCSGAVRLRRKLAVKQRHLDRLEYYARLYADYTRLHCRFKADCTRALFQSLRSQDRREFFFDPTAIDWQKYIQDIHLPGVRRHVMKIPSPALSGS